MKGYIHRGATQQRLQKKKGGKKGKGPVGSSKTVKVGELHYTAEL